MQLLGRYLERLEDVMQANALVFNEMSLYLTEFRKVKSFDLAKTKLATLLILKSLKF